MKKNNKSKKKNQKKSLKPRQNKPIKYKNQNSKKNNPPNNKSTNQNINNIPKVNNKKMNPQLNINTNNPNTNNLNMKNTINHITKNPKNLKIITIGVRMTTMNKWVRSCIRKLTLIKRDRQTRICPLVICLRIRWALVMGMKWIKRIRIHLPLKLLKSTINNHYQSRNPSPNSINQKSTTTQKTSPFLNSTPQPRKWDTSKNKKSSSRTRNPNLCTIQNSPGSSNCLNFIAD